MDRLWTCGGRFWGDTSARGTINVRGIPICLRGNRWSRTLGGVYLDFGNPPRHIHHWLAVAVVVAAAGAAVDGRTARGGANENLAINPA